MTWDEDLHGAALNIAGTNHSPLRVMAGPGTGKSFAMKRRVARLLEEGAIPGRVLAVTFTRTAAASLVKDLAELDVEGGDHIEAGTLHAFCFSLLRQQHVFEYLGRVARPLIVTHSSGILRYEGGCLLDDLTVSGAFGGRRDCTKRILAFEAAWARLQSDQPGWPAHATDRDFHTQLLRWLRFHQGMLIGEVVPEALRYLRNNPLSPVLQAFDHVIVDEYQDLNRAEQDLIDMLASHGATAIVGDVDQSIYGFRHANPEGITNFQIAHQNTHDEELTECRRCPTSVVALADHLIRNNHPPEAPARLNPKADNEAGVIHIVQWESPEAEGQGLGDHIAWLIESQGYGPADILVLTPRRTLGYAIRDCLQERTIPVHSFYHEEALDSDEAQRALTILLLLANREDRVALRRWLADGSPTGRSGSYQRLRAECEARGLSPWAALTGLGEGALALPRMGELLVRFDGIRSLLDGLAGLELNAVVDTVIPAGTPGCEVLRDAALLALKNGADTTEQLVQSVQSAVTQPELPMEGDYVRVMSLHKSKGLTSSVVIVAGCVEGLIPFHNPRETPAEQAATLREQRRLFYVAITRCTDRLVLSSFSQVARDEAHTMQARVAHGRGRMGVTVASQFIDELGPQRPAPLAGDTWQAGGFI